MSKPEKKQIRMVLGFDYGLKRIGVATGQVVSRTASPLTILKAQDGIPRWEQIAALLDDWTPDALIVGHPSNMDDSPSGMGLRAKKFTQRLHGRFGLPCYQVDERLSSFDAREIIREYGQRNATDEAIDAVSAALIIETWFAQQAEKT